MSRQNDLFVLTDQLQFHVYRIQLSYPGHQSSGLGSQRELKFNILEASKLGNFLSTHYMLLNFNKPAKLAEVRVEIGPVELE